MIPPTFCHLLPCPAADTSSLDALRAAHLEADNAAKAAGVNDAVKSAGRPAALLDLLASPKASGTPMAGLPQASPLPEQTGDQGGDSDMSPGPSMTGES